ncbi:hypothetical protein MD484_g5258, partial [Candolleomyces efflorescens]
MPIQLELVNEAKSPPQWKELTRLTRHDDPKHNQQQPRAKSVWYAAWDVADLIWQN